MVPLSTYWRVFVQGLREAGTFRAKCAFLMYAVGRALQIVGRGVEAKGRGAEALRAAVARANELSYTASLSLNVEPSGAVAPRVNLLIPALDPGIMFGGYRSYLQFAKRLQQAGARLRFIVTERIAGDKSKLVAQCQAVFPDIAEVLRTSEILNCTNGRADRLRSNPQDLYVAYSSSTAAIASNTITKLGQNRFVFYIQEEEGHFHSHNSFRAFKESIYARPHFAIFNSEFLADYFRTNALGVFARNAACEGYICFRHALDAPPVPTTEEMASRKVRKLLFFARPELHAERNLFELGLIALRHATATGAFPKNRWVINGLGCPKFPDLDLEFGQKLTFLGKLPLEEYVTQLRQHDVGLCLMFAPHPSVPNFEMAAAGMPTVTTAFVNRTRAQMEQVCPNLIAREARIDSIVEALILAEHRSFDFLARRRNAGFAWPRSWDETFSREWMTRLFSALDGELGHARLVRLFPKLELQRPVPAAVAAPRVHTSTATALDARKGSH